MHETSTTKLWCPFYGTVDFKPLQILTFIVIYQIVTENTMCTKFRIYGNYTHTRGILPECGFLWWG